MRKPYGSDLLAYEFEAALGAAGKPRDYRDTLSIAPPSHEALAKHAKRYGRDCVAETALEYGLQAAAAELAERAGSRRRRTSESMRSQVLALYARGVVPAAIADTLNISDRRVGQLLAEPAEIAA